MFRRRPVVVRRSPGLIGTMARTAVVAGTATAVSKGVSGAMRSDANQQQAAAAQAQAEYAHAEMDQMQAQMAAMQAQQNQMAPDLVTQLQQLAQLKEAGALTDAEFEAAKAKLLS